MPLHRLRRRNVKRRVRFALARDAGLRRAVEALEPRQLLSSTVSATDLNPPLTAGVTWTYQLSGGVTGTQTQTVAGPGTFNGTNATEVDVVNNLTAPTATTTTVKNYLAFTSDGLVEYGTITVASNVTTATATSPTLIEFPTSLTAGVPVTNTYVFGTSSSDSNTTQTSTETIPLTLVSGTPQSITVPAGTFSAYEIDNSTSGTGNGTAQSWFAPNVGIVKQIINGGGQPVTEELTSFTGASGGTGPTGSGALTPALKKPLASSVVATTPLRALDSMTLTAASAVRGVASAQVLLSKDTDPADSVFTLGSGRTAVNVTSGKSRPLALRFANSIPASVAPGTYNVLLVTTDPSGATQTVVSQQLTVVAPIVDLTGSIVRSPASVKAGRKVPLTFTVANSSAANVPATGAVQIQFETSPDGLLSDATVVESVIRHVNLLPGRKATFGILLPSLNASSFVVVDVDPGNAAFANDADPTNNVFATAQAIVVS